MATPGGFFLQFNEVVVQYLWHRSLDIEEQSVLGIVGQDAQLLHHTLPVREPGGEILPDKVLGQPPHGLEDGGEVLEDCVELLAVGTFRELQALH